MLVDDFRMFPIEIDVQGYVQIASVPPIRSARDRSRDLLPLADGYGIAQVKYGLLPMRVLGERRRGETERLPHAREGTFEVRHEAVNVIPPLGAKAEGGGERQIVLRALLQIDVEDRHGIRDDKLGGVI